MTTGSEERGAGPTGDREILEAGPPPSRNRWVLIGLVGVVVAMLIGVRLTGAGSDLSVPPPSPSPRSAPTAPSSPAEPSPSASSEPASTPTVVHRGSAPLAPGAPEGTLYLRTNDVLYAVDPATGRVVRTAGVDVGSGGPVALVPSKDAVVVRPLDSVPGLLVRDGRQPQELQGLLRTAEQVVPGPGGRLWASRTARPDGSNIYSMVDSRGRIAGASLSATGWFRTDGSTGLLLDDVSGVWQAYPGPLRRISIGAVVAVGPGHYQVTECDDSHRCSDYVYDRSTQQRQRIGPATSVGFETGVISPAGTYSAVLQGSNDQTFVIKVERLADGTAVRSFEGPLDGYSSSEQFAVWLSDRWVAVLERGRLVLYDPERNQVVSPDLDITGAEQIAWRAS